MKRFRSSLLTAIIASCVAIMSVSCTPSSDDETNVKDLLPDRTLDNLRKAIDMAPSYAAAKTVAIDSLKFKLMHTSDNATRCNALIDIASQYRQFNTDSAVFYGRLAARMPLENSPELLRTRANLAFANALSTAGLFPSSIQVLDSLNGKVSGIESKIEFWKSARFLYSYMLAFVQNHGEYADLFRRKYIECDDSLLSHLPKSDSFYKFIHAERLVRERRWNAALSNLTDLLEQHPIESNIYGMSAYQLAEVYKNKGDFRKFAEMLALSAESDIRCCVREGIALPNLANWLYNHGDIDNAFNFINFALQEANSGNTRMQMVTISALMPLIDHAYRKKIDDSRSMIEGYLFVSLALLVIAAALSAVLIRNIRINRYREKELANTSKKLEAYVGNFIGLCSNYASRLEQLAKLVTRKLNAGQTADLQKLVSSGRFTEEDNEEFYQLIDKAILDIFPNFVDNINTLLAPDKKISLKPGEALNPELRIYAFIRLGMDQSSRIAQILHYSVNTVYAYRNRMRNRAINRETFDADVSNLGREKDSIQVLLTD